MPGIFKRRFRSLSANKNPFPVASSNNSLNNNSSGHNSVESAPPTSRGRSGSIGSQEQRSSGASSSVTPTTKNNNNSVNATSSKRSNSVSPKRRGEHNSAAAVANSNNHQHYVTITGSGSVHSNGSGRSCLKSDRSSGGNSIAGSHASSVAPSSVATSPTAHSAPAAVSSVTIKRKKSVQWHAVHVRRYERIVGDNPSCSSGAPVGIGWAHSEVRTTRLDDYEAAKPRRKSHLDLILTRQDREEILIEWGATFSQIIEAIRSNIKVKNQRRRTVNSIGTYDKWEEAIEKAGRRLKRTFKLHAISNGNGSQKQMEQYNRYRYQQQQQQQEHLRQQQMQGVDHHHHHHHGSRDDPRYYANRTQQAYYTVQSYDGQQRHAHIKYTSDEPPHIPVHGQNNHHHHQQQHHHVGIDAVGHVGNNTMSLSPPGSPPNQSMDSHGVLQSLQQQQQQHHQQEPYQLLPPVLLKDRFAVDSSISRAPPRFVKPEDTSQREDDDYMLSLPPRRSMSEDNMVCNTQEDVVENKRSNSDNDVDDHSGNQSQSSFAEDSNRNKSQSSGSADAGKGAKTAEQLTKDMTDRFTAVADVNISDKAKFDTVPTMMKNRHDHLHNDTDHTVPMNVGELLHRRYSNFGAESVDSHRPTSVIHVDPDNDDFACDPTVISDDWHEEDEFIVDDYDEDGNTFDNDYLNDDDCMEPYGSNLTMSRSSGDGFDKLVRDDSHWQVASGSDRDYPRIRRTNAAVVISEDADNFESLMPISSIGVMGDNIHDVTNGGADILPMYFHHHQQQHHHQLQYPLSQYDNFGMNESNMMDVQQFYQYQQYSHSYQPSSSPPPGVTSDTYGRHPFFDDGLPQFSGHQHSPLDGFSMQPPPYSATMVSRWE